MPKYFSLNSKEEKNCGPVFLKQKQREVKPKSVIDKMCGQVSCICKKETFKKRNDYLEYYFFNPVVQDDKPDKPEIKPFLSSNELNIETEREDNLCEDWVSGRRFYDFLLPLKRKNMKSDASKQLSYIKYEQLRQKKIHLEFLQEEFYDKAGYDVHLIISQLCYDQQMKDCEIGEDHEDNLDLQ
ncbi:17769_t:CDS:2 [Funneliformis geosporum]|uniref:1782_t:CDS:1 n=1 Tax=Funneliformis geosporum TaxID=1117311 RepID=A0A9W4SE51_9GLOM|nr:1782_t:CDS:2 [Funneliformis geosporum]CAI2167198.1 17769_t:CDS:2 [Funneliformis geosporum]